MSKSKDPCKGSKKRCRVSDLTADWEPVAFEPPTDSLDSVAEILIGKTVLDSFPCPHCHGMVIVFDYNDSEWMPEGSVFALHINEPKCTRKHGSHIGIGAVVRMGATRQ